MRELKAMKETLTSIVQGQMAHIDQVDTKELGEAIDMIKDLSEAIYYCSVVEAMEESKEEKKFSDRIAAQPVVRDMDRDMGRMYYHQEYSPNNERMNPNYNMNGNWSESYNSPRLYNEPLPSAMRDSREGKSYMRRRTYMESKETHKDPNTQMKELEKYMEELSGDIVDMIKDSTPEQKVILQQKLSALANKIV